MSLGQAGRFDLITNFLPIFEDHAGGGHAGTATFLPPPPPLPPHTHAPLDRAVQVGQKRVLKRAYAEEDESWENGLEEAGMIDLLGEAEDGAGTSGADCFSGEDAVSHSLNGALKLAPISSHRNATKKLCDRSSRGGSS